MEPQMNTDRRRRGADSERGIWGEHRSATCSVAERCYRVLFRGKDPLRAVSDLMQRGAKDELA